jgi:hypothetical protein
MRKRPSPDRIAEILREVQADLDAGLNVGQACRKVGYSSTNYYRWNRLSGKSSVANSIHERSE